MTGKAIVKLPPKAAPFGRGRTWTMVADDELAWLESNTELSATERILFAAQRRSNWWGHASFGPGEMRDLIGGHRNTVTRALSTLRQQRRIAPESTTSCVVMTPTHVRRQTSGARVACLEPAHRKNSLHALMWLRGLGWEQYPGQWDKALAEDTGAEDGDVAYYLSLGMQAQVVNINVLNNNGSGQALQVVASAEELARVAG